MEIWYRRDTGLEHLLSRIQAEGCDTDGLTVPGVGPHKFGVRTRWGNIFGNIREQLDLKNALDDLQRQIDEALPSGKIFVYKGQVPTYEDLPNDPNVGDVWDVADTGSNYVWNGTDWDNLSSIIDLSEYAKISDVDQMINEVLVPIQIELQALQVDKADKSYVDSQVEALEQADTALQNAIDKVAEDLAEHIADADQNAATKQELADAVSTLEQADENLQDSIEEVANDLQDYISQAEETNATKEELTSETEARQQADEALDGRLDTLEAKDLVEYTDISNVENPNRKAIVFKNHDGVFGKDTDGNTRNIAMISKYNVADFGTSHLHTNLNTQQIVTVNDNQAVLTDKNLNNVLKSGDNVVIDEETVTDPTTGFQFKTYTINAELSGTSHRIDEVVEDLEQEIQDRQEAEATLQDNIDLKANASDVYTKLEANDLLVGKIDKLTTLGESVRGNIVQYVGENGTYKHGYFYKYFGEQYLEFEPMGTTGTVEVSISDFKALLQTHCEDRPFTAEDIISGHIGYYNTTRYSFNANTLDGKFFFISLPITEFQEAGVTFNPALGAQQGFKFTCNLSNDTWKRVDVQPHQDISGKADASVVDNLIDTVDDLLENSATKAELAEKADADVVYTKTEIDEIVAGLEPSGTVFKFKGNVASYTELEAIQEKQIGDVYNLLDTGANYAWTGTVWDKLSETIDLSSYDTIAAREQAVNDLKSKIWTGTLQNGHLYSKKTNNQGGYALIFNEGDGGGSQVYDKTDDVISYVGTNLEEGHGDENGVNVQIYSKNKTTNEGVRINVNTQKAYYLKGPNAANPADRELAVQEDIISAKSELQEAIDEKASQEDLTELQDTVDNTLAHQDGNIQNILLQMETLERRIEDLKSLDYEVVTFYDGGDTEYNNPVKDFQLSGAITSPAIITSNSVTLKESTMTATYMDLYADNDVIVKQSTFSGSVPKATSNAIMRLRANGYMTVRDYNFTIEKAYNGIECNLSEAIAKSIVIDNVDFDGPLSNNAISVFGMANGGVLTIANCHFKKVSNMLRISNRLNTTWTINIINCVVDEWETGQYGGAIILQDYTSKTQEEVATKNEFHNLTINIQNLTKPDGTKLVPCDLATICGTQDDNQIIYVYDNFNGVRAYDSAIYPTINIQ